MLTLELNTVIQAADEALAIAKDIRGCLWLSR